MGWWKFEEGSGVSASDSSGQGITGTLTNNPTWNNNCARGKCVGFDGSSSYVNAGANFDFTSSAFTLAFWIKLNSYTTGTGGQGPIPVYKGGFQTNGYYAQITAAGSTFIATNQAAASQQSSAGAGSVPLNVWTHIAYARNGASIRVYINGVDRTAGVGTHVDPTTSANNFQIGRYSNNAIGVDGQMDDVRVYNRTLTSTEVNALFVSGVSIKNGKLRGKFNF